MTTSYLTQKIMIHRCLNSNTQNQKKIQMTARDLESTHKRLKIIKNSLSIKFKLINAIFISLKANVLKISSQNIIFCSNV